MLVAPLPNCEPTATQPPVAGQDTPLNSQVVAPWGAGVDWNSQLAEAACAVATSAVATTAPAAAARAAPASGLTLFLVLALPRTRTSVKWLG